MKKSIFILSGLLALTGCEVAKDKDLSKEIYDKCWADNVSVDACEQIRENVLFTYDSLVATNCERASALHQLVRVNTAGCISDEGALFAKDQDIKSEIKKNAYDDAKRVMIEQFQNIR